MGSINIIGAGLSGLSAAITLAEKGICCNLISAGPSERAQSVLAEGGINAALDTMGENDTIAEHFADTMRGGVDLADPAAVHNLTDNAPDIVRWLVSLGVPFHMENGKLIQRNFGGQKKKRTAYAKSSTGKVIMSALTDEARKYEAAGKIVRFPHHEAVELIYGGEDDSRYCRGVKITDTYTDKLYACYGEVILCSGGMNGMFPERTTGTVHNTGEMTAMAFADGIELANIEFIQYHPTTIGISGKRMLISEAARGEGGRLFVIRNGKPWYFMEELYPELGNLMPRDVVSREIVNVTSRSDCEGHAYLDLTGIPKTVWNSKLSDMRDEIISYMSKDPMKEPIAISPGIHYFMGGIYVDAEHKTSVPGLFAAGECACQYHGANRLGGNSMLGAIFGGKKAANSVLSGMNTNKERGNADVDDLGTIPEDLKKGREISAVFAKRLSSILLSGLGIIRSEEQIANSLKQTDELLKGELTASEYRRALLGKAMLISALERRESRGAHFRTDYSERSDTGFKKTTVCTCRGNNIEISFKDISGRGGI